MLNVDTKRHIDAARDVLVGVAPNPTTQIDQITYALIYKFMDDMDQAAIKAGGEPSFFVDDLKEYAWTNLVSTRLGNQDKLALYRDALAKFSVANQLPELFRTIFRGAALPYNSPETLGLFLKEISFFDYTHPEELGNAYEYLLSIMSSQGDAGQFRTPRHIIDFIVDVLNPTKDDKILDPACGTAGFLVSTFNHILEQHDGLNDAKKVEKPLTPDDKKKLMQNLEGYDIDPTMVRIAQVNMYLHQFKNPKIIQYDSLTSEERWNDKFDVVLANPPFMTPKGGIKPHNKFGLKSNRSEVLFVDYIMNHLKPSGRAGVIVPEGIIFQAGTAYKELRKNLIEYGLYAVVSLPGGVFQPYSGVKTSILFINQKYAKTVEEIAFIKIGADGFDLGSSKRAVERNDLPDALAILEAWKEQKKIESPIVSFVEKKIIQNSTDYNLNGDRYKKGVDHLNTEWGMASLGEICDVYQPKTITGAEISEKGRYKVFGANGVIGFYDKFNHEDSEVAVTCRGATCGTVNYTEPQSWITGNAMVVKPKDERIDKRFLFHLLSETDFTSVITGSAQPQITGASLKPFEIPFPPIEVQRQIAAELDGYSSIIQGARQVIQNFKPSFDIDGAWPIVELADICDIKNGYAFASGDMGNEVPGSLPVLKIGNIRPDGSIDSDCQHHLFNEKLSSFLLKSGDIVIAMTGATVGKVASIPSGSYLLNQRVAKISSRTEQLLSDYLSAILQSSSFYAYCQDFATGGAQGNISGDQILKYKIPLPSAETQILLLRQLNEERELISSSQKLIAIYENRTKTSLDKLWM
jgi:type I restriction enzyme M protein